MVLDQVEAEVQRMLEDEKMLVRSTRELRSLRRLLKQQRDFNAMLEEHLKCAKDAQMMQDDDPEFLNRMELQIQQQFEKVSAMHKKMFRKHVEVGRVATNTATSVGSASVQERGQGHDGAAGITEDVQAISTNDEHEHQLDEPIHPRQSKDYSKVPRTPKKVQLNRKGNSDSGQFNIRELLDVRVLCDRKSVIVRSDDGVDLNVEDRQFEKASTDMRRELTEDNFEQSEKEEGALLKKQVGSSRNRKNDGEKLAHRGKVWHPSSANTRKREKRFKCNICSQLFYQRINLISHSRIHTGEKPFKCEKCKKSFGRSSSLILHLRIHTGKRSFKCQVCDASFIQKIHLSRHLTIHTGERQFKCDACKKSFHEKKILLDHITIHSGEKPYKCDACKKAFHYRRSLFLHKRVHFRHVYCKLSSRI